jgi:hypothetical protein
MKASGMRRKVVRGGATAAGVLQVVNSGASRFSVRFRVRPISKRQDRGYGLLAGAPMARRSFGRMWRASEGKQLSRRRADTRRQFKRIETASYFPVDLR